MIKAIKDSIIVEPIYEEKHMGVIIPVNNIKFRKYDGAIYGLVVSVGPDYRYEVKPGDKICFRRHEGREIKFDGKVYLKLKSAWVEGVMC